MIIGNQNRNEYEINLRIHAKIGKEVQNKK